MATLFPLDPATSIMATPRAKPIAVSAKATVKFCVKQKIAAMIKRAYETALALQAGQITEEEDEAANDAAELASAQAQVVLTPLVLNAITHAFDALAASATRVSQNLDRHWRNARTAGNHNPCVFKARLIGDLAVNGTELPRVWAIGASK